MLDVEDTRNLACHLAGAATARSEGATATTEGATTAILLVAAAALARLTTFGSSASSTNTSSWNVLVLAGTQASFLDVDDIVADSVRVGSNCRLEASEGGEINECAILQIC